MKLFHSRSIFLNLTILFCLGWCLPASLVKANVNKLPQHSIDLSFTKIPLKTLLELMGNLGQLNLVLSDSIEGHEDINLHQIPWNDAFEALLAKNRLAFHTIGEKGLLWVAPHDEINSFHKNLAAKTSSGISELNGQVMIEARIVEADQRFARNLGVKLGIQNSGSSVGSASTPHKNSYQTNWDLSANGVNGFLPASSSITLLNKNATELLQVELSALEANGSGNIVANPRVVTANGVKALIEQGTELPYQSSTKEGSKVLFRKANLRLEVTPKLLSNRQVLMHVEINKDSIGMKTEQGYAIDTKNLRSQIMVEDGGTAVIGGIYLQTNREDIVKVPFLGDLPLIGKLFQHKSKMNDKTELLVFITPTLINPATSAKN